MVPLALLLLTTDYRLTTASSSNPAATRFNVGEQQVHELWTIRENPVDA